VKKRPAYRLLALFLAFWAPACGWKITPPAPPERIANPKKIAEGMVLKVNDSAVIWGGGRLGDIVRDTLVSSGTFGHVYFPIEPRNPPALRMAIDASGTVDEEVGLGIVKAALIGVLLFLPVGVIRFNKTFNLNATVALFDGSRELRRFQVTTATGVSHTMFSQIEDYETAAQTAAFRDLGERIAAELGTVPLSAQRGQEAVEAPVVGWSR
jgi:hypothetical protein